MSIKTSLIYGLVSSLAILGSQVDVTFAAPIEEVLKSLQGLSARTYGPRGRRGSQGR